MKQLLSVFLVVFLAVSLAADEKKDDTKAKKDWVTFYYRSPTPEEFVKQVKAMSKAGLFAKKHAHPPLTAFFSQVMRTNADKIPLWLDELKDLDQEEQDIFLKAAFLSNTDSSQKYFKEQKIEKYAGKKQVDLLKIEIDQPSDLDAMWGYFMATGEAEPIYRIISAFKYSDDVGSLEKYKSSQKTEADKKAAYRETIFRSAMWSLESNCQQHPRVMEITEKYFASKKPTDNERIYLGIVLSKLKPEKYKVVLPKVDKKDDAEEPAKPAKSL
jgi:hypothetical protein